MSNKSSKPVSTENHFTAAKLIEWRTNMGYSQRDACDALGCSRGALGGWENGNPIPRYIGLACAALALGMEPLGK